MKKLLIISAFVIGALLPNFGRAESATQGVPFQALWDAVAAINAQIQQVVTDLQNQIDNIQLIPGPQGPQGPQGIQGEQGEPGAGWDENRIALLEGQVVALTDKLSCLTKVGNDLYFDGCNVNIRNGAGDSLSKNGLGNLIIGYNEPSPYINADRSGSHILVIGPGNAYSSYSGMVVGNQNSMTGEASVVLGGSGNVASGYRSSVFGGGNSTASGRFTSVTGGDENTATGEFAAVCGGMRGIASGAGSSVTGGFFSIASGDNSSVTGGYYNTAQGAYSSVSGGSFRTVTSTYNWAAGSLVETN